MPSFALVNERLCQLCDALGIGQDVARHGSREDFDAAAGQALGRLVKLDVIATSLGLPGDVGTGDVLDACGALHDQRAEIAEALGLPRDVVPAVLLQHARLARESLRREARATLDIAREEASETLLREAQDEIDRLREGIESRERLLEVALSAVTVAGCHLTAIWVDMTRGTSPAGISVVSSLGTGAEDKIVDQACRDLAAYLQVLALAIARATSAEAARDTARTIEQVRASMARAGDKTPVERAAEAVLGDRSKEDEVLSPADSATGREAMPSRYAGTGREMIDVIRDRLDDDGFVAFCVGNAIKYRARAGKKGDGKTDIEKATWYEQMATHVDSEGKDAADPRSGRPGFVPYRRASSPLPGSTS